MIVLYFTMDGGMAAEETTRLATSDQLPQIVEDHEDLPEEVTAMAAADHGLIALCSKEGAESAIAAGVEKGVVDLRPFCYTDDE